MYRLDRGPLGHPSLTSKPYLQADTRSRVQTEFLKSTAYVPGDRLKTGQ